MTLENRYPRDSFDRFGSDLSELILSYLPLNDKFKYESICGHWRSHVFNSQTILYVTDCDGYYSLKSLANNQLETKYYNIYTINNTHFEAVLKKCWNIRIIKIDWKCICDETSLELIARYCPHLSRFTISSTEHYPFSERVLHLFGANCGRSLNTFETDDKFNGNFKVLLNYCTNLKTFSALNDCHQLFDDNPLFLPKLRELNYLLTEDKDLIKFISLPDKYGKRLRSLTLSVKIGETGGENAIIASNLNQLLDTVAKFCRLERLVINLKGYYGQSFAAGIQTIGRMCKQLDYFHLETYDSLILENIFSLLKDYHNLRYLCLNCRYLYKFESMQNLMYSVDHSVDYGSVKSLANCRHLTHLKLNLLHLNDSNLESIDSFLPELKFLELKSSKRLTDTTVHSIAKLENLSKLRLFCKNIRNQSICDLITRRPLLGQMYFDGFPNISEDCLLALWYNALKNPKVEYNFYYSGPTVSIGIKQFPHNLRVSNFWDKQWY